MRRLKLGVVVPPVPDVRAGGETAARAERAGFDAVCVGDHVVWYTPFFDPFVTLAAYGLATERVRLETCVLLLSLRHPVLVAQCAVTIEHLSGGRLTLGVGVGGEGPQEFAALGIPLHERGSRTSEAIRVMRRLWTEDRVDHAGPHFPLEGAWANPKPRAPIPIGVGGRSEGAKRRAGRLGDRWTPMFLTPDRFAIGIADVAEIARAAGRECPEPGVQLWTSVGPAEESEARLAAMLPNVYRVPWEKFSRYCVWGPPEAVADALAGWAEAGARHANLILVGDIAASIDALGRTRS